jgi:hypothetical protein
MSKEIQKSNHNTLPTLAELHHAPDIAFKNDQLNLLLNQEVPAKWIKHHPTAKVKNDKGESVPLPYIPIDKVEFLLTKIFQDWEVEIIREGVMFQSIYVTIKLTVTNPLTGEKKHQYGVGACPVQTDSGKSAADLAAIKSNAVQLALPAAESYAIKDAAEKFGKLFGKDLSRRDTLAFSASYMENKKTTTEQKEEERIIYLIQDAETLKDLLLFRNNVPESLQHLFNEKMTELEGLSNG